MSHERAEVISQVVRGPIFASRIGFTGGKSFLGPHCDALCHSVRPETRRHRLELQSDRLRGRAGLRAGLPCD